MINRLLFVLLTVFIFCSCGNFVNEKNGGSAATPNPDQAAEIAKLNNLIIKYEQPAQKFKISATKPSKIEGKVGTVISVNPDDLVTVSGKPLGKTIDVELKELTNQQQLITANAQTVSDGKLLVSGGAYFIGMTSDGEEIKLKEGKKLSVAFPQINDESFSLFYGQRNALGQMNWKPSDAQLKLEAAIVEIRPQMQAVQPQIGSASPSPVARPLSDSDRISEMDAVIDYVESGDTNGLSKPSPQENALSRLNPEQKAKAEETRKDYIITKRVFQVTGIDQLGWINCDYFLDDVSKTNIYAKFNPSDSVKSANVFLVFKKINSVMQASYYMAGEPQFYNLPIGYQARLIAYSVKNEKVFAYSSDITIAKDQKIPVVLKESNEKDFKKLIVGKF
jgi:hypothetical protein